MAFIFIDPARRKLRKKAKKDEKSQRILDAINDYLDEHLGEPVKWLLEFWAAQAAACTYQELVDLATVRTEPDRMYSVWLQDYTILQSYRITPMLQDAMEAGAKSSVLSFTSPIPAGSSGSGSGPVIPIGSIPTPGGPAVPLTGFSTSEANVMEWIQTRGAELVTNATQDQIDAIRHIIAESTTNHMSSAETAKYIRPTIGLTERQAEANLKHYNAVKEQLRKDHPRMTEEAIEKKARASAERYAKKQLRTRAQTIAETEMAKAYNRGNHEYIRQLMQRGEIPIMREVWTTAKSGDVCPACEDLEGEEVAFDEEFSVEIGKNVTRTLSTDVPPLHPRCRCALQYVETGEYVQNPVDNPQEDDTIETDAFDLSSSPDSISIPDTQIHRSVGAMARNYDILDPETDEKFKFVEGTKIQNSEVFAGYGTRHPLREEVAVGLSEQIGGDPKKWQHCKGIGHIDVDGEDIRAEVHWFQEKTVGKHKFKIKAWIDDES